MAALTQDRQLTASRHPEGHEIPYPVAASTEIFKGALVGVNAAGFLVPYTAVATIRPAGKAQEARDNSSGANGDLTCTVRWGVHKWDNSSGDPVDQSHIGDDAYAEDDQTVTDTAGSLSICGKIVEFESDGVWVLTDPSAFA